MVFEIRVVGDMPLEAEMDLDVALKIFLRQIGYLAQDREETIGYRIFRDFFLHRPERVWSADEIASELGTSRPTVYRYIKKLRNLGLIEEGEREVDDVKKRGYRMKYGDLVRAWGLVESHVKLAMENYRRSVEHIARLAKENL
jgi:predicted transcriptional regulator